MACGLHGSVDGRGLKQGVKVPSVHSWVEHSSHLMSGANYIGTIKIRGNLMPTVVRMARGRLLHSLSCDACRHTESLGHILQVCPGTSGSRIDRHNSVLSRTVKILIKKGWSVLVELAITTPVGLRRPDIVAWNSSTCCYIVYVTVAADNAELGNVHKFKVDYYNNQHICNWAVGVSGKSEVVVSSISFNCRGAVALESYELMKNELDIGEKGIQLLAAIVVEKGFKCYMDFRKCTYRCPRWIDSNYEENGN